MSFVEKLPLQSSEAFYHTTLHCAAHVHTRYIARGEVHPPLLRRDRSGANVSTRNGTVRARTLGKALQRAGERLDYRTRLLLVDQEHAEDRKPIQLWRSTMSNTLTRQFEQGDNLNV
jgi:hypothetical protein